MKLQPLKWRNFELPPTEDADELEEENWVLDMTEQPPQLSVREDPMLYIAVLKDSTMTMYSAVVTVRGVDGEGEGETPIGALEKAYEELLQEARLVNTLALSIGAM